ncbi:hypothetical protein BGZ63DRAFT_395810 [Mariannaea sp. PMI_226]|nr:hypothetical protein BGZ63DRAFT_395810 [Mariannaea sp. PMI_226]
MSNNPWADDGRESWKELPPPPPPAPRNGGGEQPPALRPDMAFDSLEKEEEAAWETFQDNNKAETNPFKKKNQQDAGPGAGAAAGAGESLSNPWSADSQLCPPESKVLSSSSLSLPAQLKTPDDVDDDDAAWEKPTVPTAPSPALISLPSDNDSPAWDEEERPSKSNNKTPMTAAAALSNELTDDTYVWEDLGSSPSQQRSKTKAEDWNLIDAEPNPTLPPALPPRQTPTTTTATTTTWKPSRQPVDGAEAYQVKNIQWHDSSSFSSKPRTSPILIQNANGPCPLVALVNALTLTTPAADNHDDTALVQVLRSREQVSLNLLLDAVFDELMSPRRTSSEDALPDVSDLYEFLRSLHTGMNVNPRFIPTERMINAYKRTSLTHLHPTERGDLIPGTFENTAEMSLYATFSIPLIHGWLPAKSEPAYAALERQAASYEDAQNLLFREEELEQKLMSSSSSFSSPSSGLSGSEQQLYQDILLIKDFLLSSATQLTHWGIEVIGKAIRPGTFAIMFRNDHFSTLYCHPQTMQLLTLVTDAGFKSHENIVWETLSDINGEMTEYLSGDFQVVSRGDDVGGVAPAGGIGSDGDGGEGEWTTVQRRGKAREPVPQPTTTAITSSEQEDRDLALALQLQEEEDERHRAAEARRRRESILSEQYIEQQQQQQPQPQGNRQQSGRQPGSSPPSNQSRGGIQPSRQPSRQSGRQQPGLAPIRTSSITPQRTATTTTTPQQVRSLIPPQTQGVTRATDGDDAPPSYEQSAQDRAFQPPVGHPSHAGSPTVSRQNTRTTSDMPTTAQRPMRSARPPVSPSAVLGNGPSSSSSSSRDRDCLVM